MHKSIGREGQAVILCRDNVEDPLRWIAGETAVVSVEVVIVLDAASIETRVVPRRVKTSVNLCQNHVF